MIYNVGGIITELLNDKAEDKSRVDDPLHFFLKIFFTYYNKIPKILKKDEKF